MMQKNLNNIVRFKTWFTCVNQSMFFVTLPCGLDLTIKFEKYISLHKGYFYDFRIESTT